MPSVTLRDLDERTFEAVTRRARRNNHSVETEIEDLLITGLSVKADREELVAIARRIAAMTPPGPQTDSTILIREDRDR